MLVVLLSLYVLFSPDPGGPTGPPGSDKLVHLVLFALLAGTTQWRFGPLPARLLGVALYAGASEVVQALLLPHRSGDLRDVVADLAGACLGWLLAGSLLTTRRR